MIKLPIHDLLTEVAEKLSTSHLVLEAPPGAGRSTALPLWLMQHWYLDTSLDEQSQHEPKALAAPPANPRIILVQPRRVAATSLAYYLAESLQEQVGQRVGYQIRGERRASSATELLIVTEGIFTQLIQADPSLEQVELVIFDEFHERNLHSDLGFALCVDSLELSPMRRIMIMSATIPGQTIQNWLLEQGLTCALLLCQGRAFPISYHDRPITSQQLQAQARFKGSRSAWELALPEVVREALTYAQKGVLVFLPGVREIRYLAQQLEKDIPSEQLYILHGGLSIQAQQEVLKPNRSAQAAPRIVLATNLAETSLTLPDIDVVVDSGRERHAFYDPKYGLTQLKTQMISRASAVQRAGRAGRVQAGHCFRLWNTETQERFDSYSIPALEREDLSRFLLELKIWGVTPHELAWLSPPSQALLQAAEQQLTAWGVLENEKLTAKGWQFANLSTEVRYAAVIEAATQLSAEIQALAAWFVAHLEEQEVRLEGDLEVFLKQRWQASIEQANQRRRGKAGAPFYKTLKRYEFWLRYFELPKHTEPSWQPDVLGSLLLAGYADRVAQVQASRVQLATGMAVAKPEHLAVVGNTDKEYLIAIELYVAQTAQLHAYVAVPLQALLNSQNYYLKQRDVARWRGAQQQGGLESIRQTQWGALVLAEQANQAEITTAARTSAFVDLLQQKGWQQTAWGAKESQLCTRIRLALLNIPSPLLEPLGLAEDWTEAHLLASVETWAAPWLSTFKRQQELQSWQPYEALSYWVGREVLALLERELPVKWTAPSGRTHSIQYDLMAQEQVEQDKVDRESQEPTSSLQGSALVALKLQEVFGTPSSPKLAQNKLPLTFELLAPNGRLLHKTADLASFWANAWPEVKKEMRGRYPKHPWPDDPIAAEPTHLTQRALNLRAKASEQKASEKDKNK